MTKKGSGKKGCDYPGCKRPHRAKGWCETHYKRWRQHGNVDDHFRPRGECSIEGCHRPHKARGLCGKHWQRWNKHGDPLAERVNAAEPCAYEGCTERSIAFGYCRRHYDRMRNGRSMDGKRPRGKCAICPKPHHSHGLCRLHMRRWQKWGDPWFDGKNFPKPPSNRIQPMFVPLDLDPLLRFIAERGGLAAAIARSGPGFENGGAERDKIEKALDRAAIRGYIDLAVADHICVNGLRTHPALIWPVDYWTAERKETEEDEIEEDEWEEAA